MNLAKSYRELVRRILGRELVARDGIAPPRIEGVEKELKFCLPLALREYYRVAGNLDEINERHNRLLKVEELHIAGDYLLFMEENQSVVFWGVKVAELGTDDPEVWQGLNEVPIEWYSEKMPVSQFLAAMFLWTFGIEAQPQ